MEKKMYVWVHATSPTLKVEGEKKLCQFAFCVRLTTEEPQCTWSKKNICCQHFVKGPRWLVWITEGCLPNDSYLDNCYTCYVLEKEEERKKKACMTNSTCRN